MGNKIFAYPVDYSTLRNTEIGTLKNDMIIFWINSSVGGIRSNCSTLFFDLVILVLLINSWVVISMCIIYKYCIYTFNFYF